MIDRLARALDDRSPRERVLLALLTFAVLPIVLWLALLDPLLAARDAARAERAQAQALVDWYTQTRAFIATLPAPDVADTPLAAGTPPIGAAALDAQIALTQLAPALASLSAEADGRVVLSFAAAPFDALIGWAEGLPDTAGYRIETLSILRGPEPGLVDADLALAPF